MDRPTFDAHADAGGFLEWVEFLDYRQGSPMPRLEPGTDTIFEIDVTGARNILVAFPDALSIFVDAPSIEEQRSRLIGRGDDPDHIERRLAHGVDERRAASELGSTVVVNHDVDDAVEEIETAIAAHRIEVGEPG